MAEGHSDAGRESCSVLSIDDGLAGMLQFEWLSSWLDRLVAGRGREHI